MKKRIILLVFVMGFLPMFTAIYANNIGVANTEINGINSTSQFAMVEFDVSWDNSWRNDLAPGYGSKNYDAAWVFVKFRVGTADWTSTGASSSGTTITVPSTKLLRVGMPIRVTAGTGAITAGTVVVSIVDATHFTISAAPTTALSGASIECKRIWEHCTINTTGYTQPAGSSIDVANDGKGAYVFRSVNSKQATFSVADAQLRWNYGVDGIEECSDIEVKVFAIEMVYVPQGAFYVGDGSTANIYGNFEAGTTGKPFKIQSEAAITLGGGTVGSLGNNNGATMNPADDFNDATSKALPAAFPKGYNAFYCMKHEITQQLYVDFLNTLTYRQQITRTVNAPSSAAGTAALVNTYRNGIDIMTPGVSATNTPAVYACNLDADANYNESADGQWIACNWLWPIDVVSFSDWPALRPMTELEFEKVARGPLVPMPDEYCWGNVNIVQATGISNPGASNEVASNATANCVYGNHGAVQGPIRVGSFADNASNRTDAGSGYYGVLDLEGNVWESGIVSVGKSIGRAFTGLHGDGALSTDGEANTSNTPVGADCHGFRGNCWTTTTAYWRLSNRYHTNLNQTRTYHMGGRGVRTAD